jgi:hypothetical protein
MTVIRAAAVRLSPVLYSCDGTVDKVVCKTAQLGTFGIQFVSAHMPDRAEESASDKEAQYVRV